jgi:hypothetical protein
VTYFHGDEAKKIKMADSKKPSFSTSPKAEQFLPKFHRLVLGIVGLIDAVRKKGPKTQKRLF